MSPTLERTQAAIDKANAEFWNELCGTTFAQYLGITDQSPESLRKFDQGYMDLYPYLLRHVPVQEMRGQRVLEIGLGYGTLGQKIAEVCGEYIGLDIAEGPVRMMNNRMKMQGLPGHAIQGNMLECPIPSESMDCVVSIGCFHHTGNVQRCVDESFRVLKPGGRAYIMVYNALSFRQWRKWPKQSLNLLFQEWGLIPRTVDEAIEDKRWRYDHNSAGEGAPETEFFTVGQLKRIFRQYREVKCYKENADDIRMRVPRLRQGRLVMEPLFVPRLKLLPILGPTLGLDIYIHAVK